MIAILPGLSWIRDTPESLILFLSHGELRIAGSDLSRVVEDMLGWVISNNCTAQDVVEAAIRNCGVREAIARYALRLLEDARCLREWDDEALPNDLDWLFWSSSGSSTAAKRIAAFRLRGLCYAEGRDALEQALAVSGLDCAIEALKEDCTGDTEASRLVELGEEADVLIVAGPRFSHPFTRAIGRKAVELDVPVLFVETSGFVVRVGPCVLGRDLPCLDCLRARHAANGGAPLTRTVDDLSTASAARLPRPALVPPNLRSLAFQLAAIELCRIASGETPQTFGGYLEADWRGEVKRRQVQRVPLCSGCSEEVPERFPYHVTPITA